jgi:hypothetical protein
LGCVTPGVTPTISELSVVVCCDADEALVIAALSVCVDQESINAF